MEREAVLFYKSFDEAISMLSDEDQLAVYRAITKYGLYGEETELTGAAGAIFLLAKPQIDANNRRYENGKKGGAPKGNQNATKSKKKTTKEQPINNQETTKEQPKEKEKEKEKDKKKDKEKGKGVRGETQTEMFERLITGRAVTHEMTDALREWVLYKQERREPYKEAGMTSLITQAVNKGAENGADAVCNVIRESMASGYKGIVWDRIGRAGPKKNKPPERTYDMDDLELRLLASN